MATWRWNRVLKFSRNIDVYIAIDLLSKCYNLSVWIQIGTLSHCAALFLRRFRKKKGIFFVLYFPSDEYVSLNIRIFKPKEILNIYFFCFLHCYVLFFSELCRSTACVYYIVMFPRCKIPVRVLFREFGLYWTVLSVHSTCSAIFKSIHW
jgi:hypothetical protein